LARLLELARRNEVAGPAFSRAKLAHIPIVTQVQDDLKLKTGERQCLNYKVVDIRVARSLAGLQEGRITAPTAGIPATYTQDSMVYDNDGLSQGLAIDFPTCDDSCDGPGTGTETIFTALSNQIANANPFTKELSALFEGNSTQPEIEGIPCS
jgi:hypothetical protein